MLQSRRGKKTEENESAIGDLIKTREIEKKPRDGKEKMNEKKPI